MRLDGFMGTTPADTQPLAQVGSSPIERVYQQLVIMNYILKMAFNITDEDFTWFTTPTNPTGVGIGPNYSQNL